MLTTEQKAHILSACGTMEKITTDHYDENTAIDKEDIVYIRGALAMIVAHVNA